MRGKILVENKNIVYLFGFSMRQSRQINNLIKILKEQIKTRASIQIVLIHDGVLGISKREKTPELVKELLNLPLKVYAMIPDLKARGIDFNTVQNKIQLIDYENLVDILVDAPKIVSWL